MNEKIRRLWPSALVIVVFCAVTIIQFWPALSGAASLSKVQQLAEWDSFFSAQRTGQTMLMDPSLVYLMIPYYLLKAQLLHAGQLPLWNPYSGLGCPLLADPQALAFSPLHIPLILTPGLQAYNWVLVLELIVLALSTFALARSLRLGLPASIFATVALGFCPFQRWYLELLGNGYCFIPLVFCVLLRLRQDISAGKIWLAGLGCALMMLSAHPELSFFTIMMASASLLLYSIFFERSSFTKTFLALCGAGAVTFMLAAPMLVPFLEYLRNSDSYKFGSGAPAVVRWQTLIFNMMQPGYGGASPTFGPCALLLIPLAFTFKSNGLERGHRLLVYVFAGLTILGLFITGKVFPFNVLLAKPPLTYLVVNYAFPSVLLMTVMLAAFGLQAALDAAQNSHKNNDSKLPLPAVIASLVLALAAALFAPLSGALHLPLISANFDMCLPDFAFNRNDLWRYSLLAILSAAAVAAIRFKPSRATAGALIAAVALCQSAEIITASKSMPERPGFKYEETTVAPELKKQTTDGQERFIATGTHLLRPNTNILFGLCDLRTHNPLFPKRYISFLRACGAHLDEFNQTFENPLSPLLAVGGVRAVLSQTPVISSSELEEISKQNTQPISVRVSLPTNAKIEAIFQPLQHNGPKAALFANLYFQSEGAPGDDLRDLKYNLALYDHDGRVLWFSDPQKIEITKNGADNLKAIKAIKSIPLPQKATASPANPLYIGLQVYDNRAAKWLSQPPDQLLFPEQKLKDVFLLTKLTGPGDLTRAESTDYWLMYQSPSQMRIYRDEKALARVSAVHNFISVEGEEAALGALQDRKFNPRQTVILENSEADSNHKSDAQPLKAGESDAVKITATTTSRVEISADLDQPGFIVLNDIYYPGWVATVDGSEKPILRANYLMRAVPVPAGKHTIIFQYRPQSLTIGFILCALALAAGVIVAAASASPAVLKLVKMADKDSGQGGDIDKCKTEPSAE